TDAGRGRAYLDDQISNLRFRHLGAHGVPAIPVFARVETEDLTSPAREDGVHFRGRFVRADDFYLMDRLQQHGLALRKAFRDSDTAGGAERLIRRVDRVIRPINQCDRHVDDRKAKWPVLERVYDPLLHRGNVIARNDAAGNSVFELKPRPTRQRLDLQHNIAKLTVAARLLLVPPALGDRLAYSLAVPDRRPPRRHRHHEPVGE